MEYKISFFNSLFELMAVYNFAYVGLDTVNLHTRELSAAITKAFLSKERLDRIKNKYVAFEAEISTKTVANASLLEHAQVVVSKILSNEIEKITSAFESISNKNDINLSIRFGPIYLYCGFYCFSIIYIGGLMESYDSHFRNQAFYFVHIYNLILVIPILFFLLREKTKISPLLFIFILLAHFLVTAYLVNSITFPNILFDFFLFNPSLLRFLINYYFVIAIIIISCVIFYHILQQRKIQKFNSVFYWKIVVNTVFSLSAFFYLYILGATLRFNKVLRLGVIDTTIFISFLPVILLILRSSLGVLVYRIKLFIIVQYLSWLFEDKIGGIVFPRDPEE